MADFFEGWGSYDGDAGGDSYEVAPDAIPFTASDDAYFGVAEYAPPVHKGLFVTAAVFYALQFLLMTVVFFIVNSFLANTIDPMEIGSGITFSSVIVFFGIFGFVAFILMAVGLPKTYTKVVYILGTIFASSLVQYLQLILVIVDPIMVSTGSSQMPSEAKMIISIALTVFVLIWIACLIAMIVKDKSFRGIGGLGLLATTVIMYAITVFFTAERSALYAYFFFLLLNIGSMVVLCCEVPRYYGAPDRDREEYVCESGDGDDVGESFSPRIESGEGTADAVTTDGSAAVADDKADNGGADDFFANFM